MVEITDPEAKPLGMQVLPRLPHKHSNLLRKYIVTRDGRTKLAASMKEPLRILFNYAKSDALGEAQPPYKGLSPQKAVELRCRNMYEDIAAAALFGVRTLTIIETWLRELHDLVELPEGCEPIDFATVWSNTWTPAVAADDQLAADVRLYETPRDWLKAMVDYRGTYERCDEPRQRRLGMRDSHSRTVFSIPLVRVQDRPNWDWPIPDPILKLLLTPTGRTKLARILTSGDHCLDFGAQ